MIFLSVPCKIASRCFGFSLLIGVIKLNPNFFPTARSSWRRNDAALPLQGTTAPSKRDLVLSGITKSGSNSIFTPRPLQALQEPKGELNENVLGSSSPIVTPQCGHALFCENNLFSFSDAIIT